MHKIFFYNKFINASTCFEHYVLIIRRSKLYYTASGIITPVGGRPVHRCTGRLYNNNNNNNNTVHGTATYRFDDARCCIIQF